MSLLGIVGERHEVNDALVQYTLRHPVCLLLDCDNCANPYAFMSYPAECFDHVFVVQVDLIYTFRDAVAGIRKSAAAADASTVVITTFNDLFDYHNEEENTDIFMHAWELMKKAAQEIDIIVGVEESMRAMAAAHCTLIAPEEFRRQTHSPLDIAAQTT